MCHFIEKVECVGKEKTKQAKSEPCQRLPFYGKSAIIPHISKEEDVAMAEKIKPLIVALDTNVFDNANYFYDGLDLDSVAARLFFFSIARYYSNNFRLGELSSA